MSHLRERPYWSEYPIVLLVNPLSLTTIDPLDVDISALLARLLQKMYEHGGINFRISGVALYSSSLLLKLQTESVLSDFNNGKTNDKVDEKPQIPTLRQPFIRQSGSISFDELIISFKQALRQEILKKQRSTKRHKKPPIKFPIDALNVPLEEDIDVEGMIHDVFLKIKTLIANNNNNALLFDDLIKTASSIEEIIQLFLAILYLHFYKKINIFQNEDTLDIYISLLGDYHGSV